MNTNVLTSDVDETSGILWLPDVEPDDYTAAQNYLSILLDPARAVKAVAKLQGSIVTTRRANDLLRACHREPMDRDDIGVRHVLDAIAVGKPLSPVLVVSFAHGGDIADGYHRVCAAYHLHPFTDVPCRLVHVPHLKEVSA